MVLYGGPADLVWLDMAGREVALIEGVPGVGRTAALTGNMSSWPSRKRARNACWCSSIDADLGSMDVPDNAALDLKEFPRLEGLGFTGVSVRYRSLRLMVWAVIQCGLTLMFLSPFILSLAFPEREEFHGMQYSGWWIPLALQGVLGAFWLTEEWLGFPRRGYATRHDITYRPGWFSRSTTTVPYAQIQHLQWPVRWPVCSD